MRKFMTALLLSTTIFAAGSPAYAQEAEPPTDEGEGIDLQAVHNIEQGLFETGAYWEVVRLDLALPNNSPIKLCAYRNVDAAQREVMVFMGLSGMGYQQMGVILRKQTWDFTTHMRRLAAISYGLVKEAPFLVIDPHTLIYRYQWNTEGGGAFLNGQRIEDTKAFDQINLNHQFSVKAVTYAGMRIDFGGNEPAWHPPGERNNFVSEILAKEMQRCFGTLRGELSGQTATGSTSPF